MMPRHASVSCVSLRASRPAALRVVAVVLSVVCAVFLCQRASLGQVIEIHESDEEGLARLALFEEAYAEAVSLQHAGGGTRAAVRALEGLYEEAADLHPGAGILVATRLAQLTLQAGDEPASIVWGERALDLLESDDTEGQTAATAATLLAQTHTRAGRHERSLDALVRGAPASASMTVQADWAGKIASRLEALDRVGEAIEAYEEAEALVRAGGGDPDRALTYAGNRLILQERSGRGYADLFDLNYSVLSDPYYADQPGRLDAAGWSAVQYAHWAGDSDLAEAIGREVLRQVVEFEASLTPDEAEWARLGKAYVYTAIELARIFESQRRYIEAAEVLESAGFAYPLESSKREVSSLLAEMYERAGLTDAERDGIERASREAASFPRASDAPDSEPFAVANGSIAGGRASSENAASGGAGATPGSGTRGGGVAGFSVPVIALGMGAALVGVVGVVLVRRAK